MRFSIVMLGLLLAPLNALADMPSNERIRQEKNYAFGDTRIRQIFDSRKDPMGPDFIVEVRNKGRLVMRLSEVAYHQFFAAPDNELFVGLSNSGWPNSAVIIFNSRGEILLQARHGTSAFDYCATTSTFLQLWYDGRDPQVKFEPYHYGDKEVPAITLKDCHGKTVDLLDTVRKANDKGYRTLRQEINQHSFIPQNRR